MLTEEQVKNYKLKPMGCGWYISEQGLILTDDKNEDVRIYLSKVAKMNEIDYKNNQIKKQLETNFGR